MNLCYTLDYEAMHKFIENKRCSTTTCAGGIYINVNLTYDGMPLGNKIIEYLGYNQNINEYSEEELQNIISVYGKLFNIPEKNW